MDGMATQQVVRLFAIFFIIKPCKRISESILLERSGGGEGRSPDPRESAGKKSKFWGACH